MEREELYDKFIRSGLNVGFTDDQIDFLWEYVNEIVIPPLTESNLENGLIDLNKQIKGKKQIRLTELF